MTNDAESARTLGQATNVVSTGCAAGDAIRCFMASGVDVLAIGDCYLRKEAQTVDARDFVTEFEDD